MKSSSNIVSAIQHLKMAQEHLKDFNRDNPNTRGSKLFQTYIDKIEWIYMDFISNPILPHNVTGGIKEEWNSDVFCVPAITDKVSILRPDQREMIEEIIDGMIAGEEVKFIDTPNK